MPTKGNPMQTIPVSIPYPELQPNMSEDLDDSSQKPILRHDLRLFGARVDAEFNKFRVAVIHGFDQASRRFDSIDARFNSIDVRLDSVETRLDSVETRLDSVEIRLDSVDMRLNSIDVKMGLFEKQFELIQLQFAGVHTRFDDLISHRNRDGIATLLGFVAVVVAIFWQGR